MIHYRIKYLCLNCGNRFRVQDAGEYFSKFPICPFCDQGRLVALKTEKEGGSFCPSFLER